MRTTTPAEVLADSGAWMIRYRYRIRDEINERPEAYNYHLSRFDEVYREARNDTD